MRREISQLEAQLTGIEADKKTALEDQIRYGAEEKRVRTMLEDLQSDQDRSEEQRHKLTEQIKALIGQCEKDAEKLSESEAFLSDFRTELAQLEQKAQAAQQLLRRGQRGVLLFFAWGGRTDRMRCSRRRRST